MSKSYRDKERLKSKKASQEVQDSLNSFPCDDINKKYSKLNSTKEIKRYGNNRKAYAKIKVQERRVQRKKDNTINDDQ